jgi:hypothetical protein
VADGCGWRILLRKVLEEIELAGRAQAGLERRVGGAGGLVR